MLPDRQLEIRAEPGASGRHRSDLVRRSAALFITDPARAEPPLGETPECVARHGSPMSSGLFETRRSTATRTHPLRARRHTRLQSAPMI